VISWIGRHGYGLMIALLALLIVFAGVFIVFVALPDLTSSQAGPAVTAVPSESPRPQAMAWLPLPADADCAACHQTANGSIGLKPVPAMAHPLTGWTECTACHANDRLVATAPGHTSLHASDCLLCHQPAQLPAPLSRPHRELQNQSCLSCHGQQAPLPVDMAHRTESVCWLCHRLPQVEPPLPKHEVRVGQTDCLTCHNAGNVGALPADHETRDANQCLLCHAPPSDQPLGTPPVVSPAPPVTLSRLQFE
jgi:hypothetical protein